MAERKSLTVETFKFVLCEKFKKWEGRYEEKLFDQLLNKYCFETDEVDRASLRLELKDLGFFEEGKSY